MTTQQRAYAEYLQSEHWLTLRAEVLNRDGNRCTRCQGRECLQAHHKFYRARWVDSIAADLITLCRTCHQLEHGLIPEPPTPDISTIAKLELARSHNLISRQVFLKQRKILSAIGWKIHNAKRRHKKKRKHKPYRFR